MPVKQENLLMIPKIIHYTWFSGEEMPQVVKDCMASWKRFMPDYEYRLWDMDAIKDINSTFLKEALTARKWAYASDFVRLYALYHEGGIYLDTDVMVYKSFNDLLQNKVFIGKEDVLHQLQIEWEWAYLLTSHCMGAMPHTKYIKDCLSYFDDRHFILSPNEHLPQKLRYNYVILPYIQAVIAREYGYDWSPKNHTTQYCKNDLVIYPSDYFCGHEFQNSCYCKHLSLGSWRNWEVSSSYTNSLRHQINRRIKRILDHILSRFSYALIKVI